MDRPLDEAALPRASQLGAAPRENALRTCAGLRNVTLVLVCAATWALSHGYGGIVHDARLYTLQALAHLDPASLGRDVFLRFGSQDEYTIFSPLYAFAIRHLGIEPAAAAITLTSQLAFFAAAWFLARTILSERLALLALVVLIAIPGGYGSDRVFVLVEPFVTPRLSAEALVLAALTAALAGRVRATLICFAGAVLLHAIIAMAGAMALLFIYIPIRRRAWLTLGLGAASALILPLGALLLPGTHLFQRFDPTWLALVAERSPYLFISRWTMNECGQVAAPLATLAAGALVLRPRGQVLCGSTLLAGIAGLGLTWLGCDVLHLVLMTQVQPWRSMWLVEAIGALALPIVAFECWRLGSCGRATALLLVLSWILANVSFLGMLAGTLALIVLVLRHRLQSGEARLVLFGACAALTLAVVWRLAADLLFTDAHYYPSSIPLWIRRAMSLAHDGTVPAVIALLAWWLARRPYGTPPLVALAIVSAAVCIMVAPTAWSRWTAQRYPPRIQALFAPWRRLLPPAADVFWPNSPESAWVLLERPSYLSAVQTAGELFSGDAAREMQRRASALARAVPPGAFLSWEQAESLWLGADQIVAACKTGEFPFAVTSADLHAPAVATLPPSAWPVSAGLRLYRCDDLRGPTRHEASSSHEQSVTPDRRRVRT